MKKLVIGCAIAAGVVVLVGIVGTIAIVQFARNNLPDTDAIETAYQELLETYGTPEEYAPPLDLVPDRIATFVAIRDSLAQARTLLAERVYAVQEQGERTSEGFSLKKIREVIDLAKGGIGVARTFLEMGERGTLLLSNAEMGVGEYAWLNGLSTYGWLQWDARTSVSLRELEDETHDREDFLEAIDDLEKDYRRVLLQQMVNQVGTHESRSLSAQEQALLAQAKTELSRVEEDRSAFPYRNDFPREWADLFEPYRERLLRALPQTGIGLIMEQRFNLGTAGKDLFENEGLRVQFDAD